MTKVQWTFMIAFNALALALIPLGLWGVPILVVVAGVGGTKVGLFEWRKWYQENTGAGA